MSQSVQKKRTERVPLFGTWPRAYMVVVVIFLLDVAAFYFFGRYFS